MPNNYNGTIELISGIIPKNNGTFPLVNAKDVLMSDGSRLSEVDFSGGGGSPTDVDLSNYYTKEETDSALLNMESDMNKVQEINETATEEQYPSARAVQNIVGDITELLEYIVDGGDTPPHIGAQIITWEEHD